MEKLEDSQPYWNTILEPPNDLDLDEHTKAG